MEETRKPSLFETVRRTGLTQVLIVYMGASYAVLETVDIFTDQFGLPDWFFPGSVVLILLAFPLVIATAIVQGRRAAPPAAGSEAGEARLEAAGGSEAGAPPKRWLTWRRAILGFVAAFALWGLVVTAYMTMRALGIGPVGSLVAAGVLDERERLILADFENHTSDPMLARAATEAFRIDLAQSPLVTVVDPTFIDQVISRMEQEPVETLSVQSAREVALREGIKAVVGGDVTSVGAGFVLSARLLSAESGEVLAAFRESAEDSTAVIGAIDQLSSKLRERIGESLKSIRANEPLDRVTTASLQALRKYSQAVRLVEQGDVERGHELLRDAIALDSTFAMAYRKLGVVAPGRAEQVDALNKAFLYRDRLTDRERYLTVGTYHLIVTQEEESAIDAYEDLLEIYPDDWWAMNNLALVYQMRGEYPAAERLLHRAIAVDSGGAALYQNLISSQVAQGDFESAEATLRLFRQHAPNHPNLGFLAASLASAQGDYAGAEENIRAVAAAQSESRIAQLGVSFNLGVLAAVRGRLGEAERWIREAMNLAEEMDLPGIYLNGATQLAAMDMLVRGAPEGALAGIEASLVRHPLESISPLDRPYVLMAAFYGMAGRRSEAEALLAEYETATDPADRPRDDVGPNLVRGVLALAEERPQDAIAEFRIVQEEDCPICTLPMLGRAYELAEEPDSVIAMYRRYIDTPWLERLQSTDWYALPYAYERLGQLYEAHGDVEKAVLYYGRFIELWENADPELQPRVEAARRAIRTLSGDRPVSS